MKLIVRLLISSAAVLTVVCAVTAMNIVALSRFRAVDADVAYTLSIVDALRNLGVSLTEESAALDAFIVTFKDENKSFFQGAGDRKIFDGLDALAALSKSADLSSEIGRLSTSIVIWRKELDDDLMGLRREASSENHYARLMGEIEAMAGGQVAHIREAQQSKLGAGSMMDWAARSGLVAAVLVVFATSFWQFVTIRGPLLSLATIVEKLRSNRFDIVVEAKGRRDEIGAIAGAIDQFRQSLIDASERRASNDREAAEERERHRHQHELIQSFRSSVSQLLKGVDGRVADLAVTAQDMVAIAAQTAGQSSAVAEAAAHTSINVTSVASTAEELGASVREINRQVDRSAAIARTAAEEADQTMTLVGDLSDAASEIGTVAALISGIAAQTNLLALNATIEAARAGSAGRGFAVVASEVKQLANETSRATSEIAQRIGRIQGSTSNAVEAIGQVTRRLQDISVMATFVASAVEEQETATEDIARNVTQAAIKTGEVTVSTASLAGAAEGTEKAAGVVLLSARELGLQSQSLGAAVDDFLSRVSAA